MLLRAQSGISELNLRPGSEWGPGWRVAAWEGGSQFDNGNHLMEEGNGVCVNSAGMRILQCIRRDETDQSKLLKVQLTLISSESFIRVSSEYLADIPLHSRSRIQLATAPKTGSGIPINSNISFKATVKLRNSIL